MYKTDQHNINVYGQPSCPAHGRCVCARPPWWAEPRRVAPGIFNPVVYPTHGRPPVSPPGMVNRPNYPYDGPHALGRHRDY